MSAVNQQMVQALKERVGVEIISVRPDTGVRGLSYHISKSRRALWALPLLVRARIRGARLLYASVDDGLGGVWLLAFLIFARLLRLKVYLHHHSYRYLLDRTALMAAIAAIAGPDACHVMLCDKMTADFRAFYPRAGRYFVAPNSVPRPPGAVKRPTSNGPGLWLGFLSNLTFEKGVAEFIEIVEKARAGGADVRGRIAGPAMGAEVTAFIRSRCEAMNGALEWIGPVHGESKEQFFAGIDVFVFPTKYRTESFGLVLLEALIRGVPVIAVGRGCADVLSQVAGATIVPLADDFVASAGRLIADIAHEPSLREGLSRAAALEGGAMNETHHERQMALADEMAARASDADPADASQPAA